MKKKKRSFNSRTFHSFLQSNQFPTGTLKKKKKRKEKNRFQEQGGNNKQKKKK